MVRSCGLEVSDIKTLVVTDNKICCSRRFVQYRLLWSEVGKSCWGFSTFCSVQPAYLPAVLAVVVDKHVVADAEQGVRVHHEGGGDCHL